METASGFVEGQPRPERALALRAGLQHGVFTRAQALGLGVSASMVRRRVAAGQWDQPYEGVYAVAGARLTWQRDLLSAVFAWGPDVLASHDAAAAVFALAGTAFTRVELTVPRRRKRALDHVVHRPLLVLDSDRAVVDAIPVTSPARTLVDLAASSASLRLEEMLDDALRRKLVTPARMRWEMAQLGRAGRAGVAALTALLDERAGGPVPESVFETRLLREIRRAGLPRPVLQHEVRTPSGRFFLDFAYPSVLVGIETDGYADHAGKLRWQRDRTRGNALLHLGWRIMHVTWADLARAPDRVTAGIAALLGAPAL